MTKKLKVYPNERLDLDDFENAAFGYSKEGLENERSLVWADKRSRVLNGFRIEVQDQTANPGLITVYNGVAFDRNGSLLHDEDQVNTSISLTLTGANQTFYIEAIVAETLSDSDARAFWDPTTNNGPSVPAGSETSLNVPTRTAVTWTIVTPVSTTGFDKTTNPNSTRVPLAILRTNASNQISGAQNTTLVQVAAASTLEADYASGVGSIRVLNSSLFPDSGTMTIDVGGTSPETVTITANDRDNNILTFAPITASAHQAGAIVRVGGTGRFVKENTDPNNPALSTAAPNHIVDQSQKFWAGDEIRGSALSQDKETFGTRGDLNISSTKDYVDFLAAQIRDMKFGHFRTDTTSSAPPSSFSSRPRYFDDAGSITGARTAAVTIGDGTNSFGDINGTTDTAFTAALAALPSSGGTIYIKRGTYIFANTVTISKNVTFIGDNKNTVTIQNNAVGAAFSASAVSCEFRTITFTQGTGSVNSISAVNCTLNYFDCTCVGLTFATTTSTLNAFRSTFNAAISSTVELKGVMEECAFGTSFTISSEYNHFIFDKCYTITSVNATMITAPAGAPSVSMKILNCRFDKNNTAPTTALISFPATTIVANFFIDKCTFSATCDSSASSINALLDFSNSQILSAKISNTTFSVTNAGGTASNVARLISLSTDTLDLVIENCTFSGARTMGIYGNTFSTSSNLTVLGSYFTTQNGIRLTNSQGSLKIGNCSFHVANSSQDFRCIEFDTTNAPKTLINDCIFDNKSAAAATTTRYGINLGASTSDLRIENCKFINFDSSASATSIPIRAVPATTTSVTVSGCQFDSVISQGGSYAIYLDPSIASILTCNISNNTIKNITNTNAQESLAILIADAANTVISNNIITTVSTTGAARAAGMLVVDCSSGTIANNSVTNVDAETATANGIYLYSSDGFSVTGNSVFDLETSNAAGTCRGIFLETCTRCSVVGNTVDSLAGTSLTSRGIYVESSCNRITISGNTVTRINGTTSCLPIVAASSSNIVISNNNISNLSSVDNCAGIYVTTVGNVSISSNLLTDFDGGIPLNTRGIYVNASSLVNVNGNTIKGFNAVGSWARAINITNCTGIKVNENLISDIDGDDVILILVEGGNGGVQINNNKSYSEATAPPTTSRGIFVYSAGAITDIDIVGNSIDSNYIQYPLKVQATSISNLNIKSNKVNFDPFINTVNGIEVQLNGEGIGINIENNHVLVNDTGITNRGILVQNVSGASAIFAVNISGNTIASSTSTSTALDLYAIDVESIYRGLVINNNNIMITSTGVANNGRAIRVQSVGGAACYTISICGNTIWYYETVIVQIYNSNGGSITGNTIHHIGGAPDSINVLAANGNTSVLVIGNTVGAAAGAALINVDGTNVKNVYNIE